MTRLSIGFGGSAHDTAVVVADDTRLLVGIEDERLHRRRYAIGLAEPLARAHAYCLAAVPAAADAGWTASRLLATAPFLAGRPDCGWWDDQALHALSVWLTSPFERAAVVVLDAAGDADATIAAARVTASLYLGEGNRIRPLARIAGRPAAAGDPAAGFHDHSLGDFYELISRAIGFGPMQAGKTMALAAYGDDRHVADLGAFVAAPGGFAATIRLAGDDGLAAWLAAAAADRGGRPGLGFERGAAVAFAAQTHLERLVARLLIAAHRRCGTDDLCLAGGVALNAVLVGKIPTLSPFRRLHVVSAPGDSGTAVGAALAPLAMAAPAGSPRRWPWRPFLGIDHPPPALPAGLVAAPPAAAGEMAAALAEALAAGRVIATCVGGSEFGPRALGHRSLLACPWQDGIQARLNRIKGREWFRPVAPMQLAPMPPAAAAPFWTNGLTMMQAAVPMLAGIGAATGMATAVPRAALHVDGTARLQWVEADADAWLLALLHRRAAAGRPLLLNTSFNGPGEPLVETPAEALALFAATPGIDLLMLGDRLIGRAAAGFTNR